MPQQDYDHRVELVEKNKPELAIIQDNFKERNMRQCELLSQIEDKLHGLLNKRTPDKKVTEAVPMDGDMVQLLNKQVDNLGNQNDWLERLLSHLSEIV